MELLTLVIITVLAANPEGLPLSQEPADFTGLLTTFTAVTLISVTIRINQINLFSNSGDEEGENDDEEDDEGGGDDESESDDDEEDKPRGGMCTIDWGNCSDYKIQ